ncbi:hypothetical protein BLD25_04115 [Candidatus Gracilibacteria bacterium GN02-872]|nr:hypothetical protein BLD25_04115 [Candidatus Gracilibacteria bacterium GN02-872]
MNIKIVKIFKLKTCIFIFLFYNIKTLIIFFRKMNLETINTGGKEETKNIDLIKKLTIEHRNIINEIRNSDIRNSYPYNQDPRFNPKLK